MRRRFRSQAVGLKAQPGETIVHNHPPNYAWPILTGIMAVIVGVIGLWHAALYLLSEAGDPHPERTLSLVIISVVLLVGFAFLGSWLVGQHFDRWSNHRLQVLDRENEALRYRQLMANSMTQDTRTVGPDARFANLVILVMIQAFDDYASRQGEYAYSDPRPWSRRNAATFILANEKTPVGESMASRVRPWLLERGVITSNNQINLKRYPDVASVQRLLHQPILLTHGGS